MLTLCIPDSHDTPEHHKQRYDVLSNFIEANEFDNIVQLGDFVSIDSVSSHNKGKPQLQEGARLKDDVDSGQEAYSKLMAGYRKRRQKQSKAKKSKYNPNLFWLEGNHEHRVRKWLAENPVVEGFVPTSDLVGAAKDGWRIVPYSSYCFIEGVAFTHVPHNPETGIPVGGVHAAYRAAMFHQHSVVFGHTHKRAINSVTRLDPETGRGHSVDGIACGCWLDYNPGYLKYHGPATNWWSGLVLLHHTAFGKVDVEFRSMEEIYNEYA